MSPKIKAITQQAPEHLAKLLEEAADQIEEAIVAAAAEAQAQETEAKLGLSFKITLHLDKNAVQYGLGWSVKHALTSEATLPDPSQPELPGVASNVVAQLLNAQQEVLETNRFNRAFSAAELAGKIDFIVGSPNAASDSCVATGPNIPVPKDAPLGKRGRGRPRKNPLPTTELTDAEKFAITETNKLPERFGNATEQASIAPEPAQGEVLAPEAVSTDPEPVQEAPEAKEEAVPEIPTAEGQAVTEAQPSEQRGAFVFDYEELEQFVTSNGFTLEHCKKAAASFNLLTGKETITTFEDFGEVVAGKLLNARRGFASRMALIKQNEEAQNPPEI